MKLLKCLACNVNGLPDLLQTFLLRVCCDGDTLKMCAHFSVNVANAGKLPSIRTLHKRIGQELPESFNRPPNRRLPGQRKFRWHRNLLLTGETIAPRSKIGNNLQVECLIGVMVLPVRGICQSYGAVGGMARHDALKPFARKKHLVDQRRSKWRLYARAVTVARDVETWFCADEITFGETPNSYRRCKNCRRRFGTVNLASVSRASIVYRRRSALRQIFAFGINATRAYALGDGRLVSDGDIQSLAVLDHR